MPLPTYPTGAYLFPRLNTGARGDFRSIKAFVERTVSAAQPVRLATTQTGCDAQPVLNCRGDGLSRGQLIVGQGNALLTTQLPPAHASVAPGIPSTREVRPVLRPVPRTYFIDSEGNRYSYSDGSLVDSLGTPAAPDFTYLFNDHVNEWVSFDGTQAALSNGKGCRFLNSHDMSTDVVDSGQVDAATANSWYVPPAGDPFVSSFPTHGTGVRPAYSGSIQLLGPNEVFRFGSSPAFGKEITSSTVDFSTSLYGSPTRSCWAIHLTSGATLVCIDPGASGRLGYIDFVNTTASAVTVQFGSGFSGIADLIVPGRTELADNHWNFATVFLTSNGSVVSESSRDFYDGTFGVTMTARGKAASSGLVLSQGSAIVELASPSNGWTHAVQRQINLVLRNATDLSLVFYDGTAAGILTTVPDVGIGNFFQIVAAPDGTWWVGPDSYGAPCKWAQIAWNGTALVKLRELTLATGRDEDSVVAPFEIVEM